MMLALSPLATAYLNFCKNVASVLPILRLDHLQVCDLRDSRFLATRHQHRCCQRPIVQTLALSLPS